MSLAEVPRAPLAERYAAAVAQRRAAQGHSAPDETIGLDGEIRAAKTWEYLEGLGTQGLMARRREVARLARDEGIGATAPALGPRWQVDPIPLIFDQDEWAPLAEGLQQRARLLDAILTDLYGERRLLKSHLLPAELFLGHDGYLLPADGVTIPGPRQLPVAGADIARGPDGWVVMTDRTQAPAGIGYALANRRLITRVMEPLFRASRASTLRGFFDVMQHALHRAAPPGVTSPRIVLLSPGPSSETAYDQALVATLLGHPLVVADDLMVRDGAVWLRAGGRRLRVHVIQRRVDGDWMDSLELRPESRLGVPGLMAAARRGVVSVVNPIGAGVVENIGMAPYLNRVAREVLGEDLKLAAPQTWWCGDPASRSHVLTNMERLVLRPISRSNRPTLRPGWEMTAAAREQMAAQIEAEPWAWAAQELIDSSTAPVITKEGLSPRAMVLRTFRIAVDDDYVVMPGGLAKVASNEKKPVVQTERGVITKDVWVLEGAQDPVWSFLRLVPSEEGTGIATMPALTPRAAGDLYWLGRYAERAESTARLVAVADNLVDDHISRPGSAGHTALETLLDAVSQLTGVTARIDPDDRQGAVIEQLRTLLIDQDRLGTVSFAVERTTQNALSVRELLSPETVGILGSLTDRLDQERESDDLFDAQGVSSAVLQSCLALAGIFGESIVRDEIWLFVDAGRRLERAQAMVGLLRHTIAELRSPVAEAVIVEMALRVSDSLITYRRRMAAGVGSVVPAIAALELLLEDATNPRSVRYQLDRLVHHFSGDDGAPIRSAVEAARELTTDVDHDAIFTGNREGLANLLTDLDLRLRDLSRTIEREHFAPQRPSRAFAVPEREGTGQAAQRWSGDEADRPDGAAS
ncbi:circularly permuted type 2 ATP-grasp protein [Aestuariimicrobium ganziense]|uniref:circularly permuted type 2 ATP-grasp protein n=1 Tax=Aestuariimicrobium ganziense TaxID=2773677 RepID=UPI001945A26F|nr:circularly permuted type 2 ATP-grasp protein [Aestuariimicrobium ganziense]